MRLTEVQIHNYKSLRNLSITPSPLSVLVGPNASGKSNFCDALDFLGEAYRLGLEVAVARKGGFENICFRKYKRSRAPIRFQISFELAWGEWWLPVFFRRERELKDEKFSFEHTFEIRASSTNITAPFFISSEKLEIRLGPHSRSQLLLPIHEGNSTYPILLFMCQREGKTITQYNISGLEDLLGNESETKYFRSLLDEFSGGEIKNKLPETEFMLSFIDRLFFGNSPFRQTIGSLRVFQLSPRNCREFGVPTPNPELDRFGGNLPAVVEYLKSNNKREYSSLLKTIRRVMPTLEGLETQYTHRKTLGLFVNEEGFGRPWAADDISDGTIQIIGLLVAAFDPRTSMVIIEEPENSVHPWAIRKFIEAARQASNNKQVILTTHSPVLIDTLKPDELWVVRRIDGETKINPVLELDPQLIKDWGQGHFTLSEYLDSGIIPDAVPQG